MAYESLENPDIQMYARNDPWGFLKNHPNGVFLDEIQKVPELVSYIQGIVDDNKDNGQFELSHAISQSLAGRTAIIKLLPLSYGELYGNKEIDIEEVLLKGFYPRIHDQNLDPNKGLSFYVNTYLERDVRSIKNIKNMHQFNAFLRLCAANVGQLINKSRLGNDIGIDSKTIDSWLSVLQASYILYLLPQHFNNFRKRVTKSPKIYFYDVGLASYLLGIQEKQQLVHHPLKGQLFENFIISEFLKNQFNQVKDNNLYFFRDHKGNEVDLIMDYGIEVDAIEIKLAKTFHDSFTKGLIYYQRLNNNIKNSMVIYGGKAKPDYKGFKIRSYSKLFT